MGTLILQGRIGDIEAYMDEPAPNWADTDNANANANASAGRKPKGCVFIAHPHPLYAGTMDNKVVQTISRAFTQAGWRALRFNFRGVGVSSGEFDQGIGETLDMLRIIEQISPPEQSEPIAIAGFSFGAFVACRAIAALQANTVSARSPEQIVLVGTAASRFEVPPLAESLHQSALVVHGENDDTVPLSACMDWARPQNLPVTVLPLGGHFFHGQLVILKQLILKHISSAP